MKIIPIYLIVTIFITVFILYMFYPSPKIVLVEPRVKDQISKLYQDDNNVCYRYHREEIGCAKEFGKSV
jgi:hypothetical protein